MFICRLFRLVSITQRIGALNQKPISVVTSFDTFFWFCLIHVVLSDPLADPNVNKSVQDVDKVWIVSPRDVVSDAYSFDKQILRGEKAVTDHTIVQRLLAAFVQV
jgi:hypothetical protein